MRKQIKIGLFGYGCVGQGLHHVLNETRGMKADIVKIAIKSKNKTRSLPDSYFTFDHDEILTHPDVNLIVELIDDAQAAYELTIKALKSGKNVITANKKMLATHLQELVALQREYGTALLYEGSVCGSIPIIRNLEEYYDNELLHSVSGIFNGSSNYILSKIFNENQSYHDALSKAQELGFAETDPTLDVGGFDPLYKLCILTAHAYGVFVDPETAFNYGIQTLSDFDVQFAREKDLRIKLICRTYKLNNQELTLYVMPQFVRRSSPFFTVDNEYNAVQVEAAFADKQFFQGKGAGGNPTGAAVLSDISANSYGYQYEYRKIGQESNLTYSTNASIEVYVRYADEADLDLLQFEDVKERYYGPDVNYVIGTVTLSTLLKNKEALRRANLFMVATPQ